MAVLRINRSYWLDDVWASKVPHYAPLHGSATADVVIVGGGVTGAAIAFELATAGLRATVLESRKIGRGSTAASTALLMQEPDEDLMGLERRYGRKRARRIWQLSQRAMSRFIETIRRLRLPCGLTACDSVYYTMDFGGALHREYECRRRARLGGRWLGANALGRVASIPGSGAIRTSGNAQADPYQICIGLMAAAVRRGAAVFEYSPARRVRTASDGVVIETPRGSVRAGRLIVATGYATPEFKRLNARFKLKHTYVVVTAPMAAGTRRRLGLRQVMLWDTDRPYHYARWTEDGRLMMGGADRPQLRGAARIRAVRVGAAAVYAHFCRLYPALAEVAIDYAWEGLFATTPDGLPYIGRHRQFPRHLFALGYGGNGMTFAALAADLIRKELTAGADDDHRLFSFGRARDARIRRR